MRKSLFLYNISTRYFPWIYRVMPETLYLRFVYRIKVQRKLNLDNPSRYNEKLQWLKLNDHNPDYTQMVDKYRVRGYIKQKIGEQYLIPLIGVWNDPDEIEFDKLPNQFVLKCNHDSQGIVICKDKSSLDIESAVRKLKKALKRNFYYLTKEWPYKNVSPCIIAEKYMEDSSGELKDYKVLCFNGIPKLIEVHSGRFKGKHTQDIFDQNWDKTNIHQTKVGIPNSDMPEARPSVLEEMLRLSSVLSEGIPHVRIDWYVIENRLYFGEITFFDASGFDDFEPDEWNDVLGDWIDLKNVVRRR